jgi:hypothetical protein
MKFEVYVCVSLVLGKRTTLLVLDDLPFVRRIGAETCCVGLVCDTSLAMICGNFLLLTVAG